MQWRTIGSYDDYVTNSPFPIPKQNVSVYEIDMPEARAAFEDHRDPDISAEPVFEFIVPWGAQMDQIPGAMLEQMNCKIVEGIWYGFPEGSFNIAVIETPEGSHKAFVFVAREIEGSQ